MSIPDCPICNTMASKCECALPSGFACTFPPSEPEPDSAEAERDAIVSWLLAEAEASKALALTREGYITKAEADDIRQGLTRAVFYEQAANFIARGQHLAASGTSGSAPKGGDAQ